MGLTVKSRGSGLLVSALWVIGCVAGASGQLSGYTWASETPMIKALGETSCEFLGEQMYCFGQASAGGRTDYVYNTITETWSTSVGRRLAKGNHHSIHEVNGFLYIIGGLTSGGGKVQIYNPTTRRWSWGSDIPWQTSGSVNGAVIDGEIYACGGLHADNTPSDNNPTDCARYTPGGTGQWTVIAPMLRGVDHAAVGTDGVRMYVFGGRASGVNAPSPGVSDVQIYDVQTDSWSAGANMRFGRSGMGNAPYFNGLFYVLGGETNTRSGDGAFSTPSKVFPQVDVYNPADDTWTQVSTMTAPKHGMWPVLHGNKIYIAGGGTVAGFSESNTLEVLTLPTPSPTTQQPTAIPSVAPSAFPTPEPTLSPTEAPTDHPSFAPSSQPTIIPTSAPSSSPTAAPTELPTSRPSTNPTPVPSAVPSMFPTAVPTAAPSSSPTEAPSSAPTSFPTSSPSASPSVSPTLHPTLFPTLMPSNMPTNAPTLKPTASPTESPVAAPTMYPTSGSPTSPTSSPTAAPTVSPTSTPTTCKAYYEELHKLGDSGSGSGSGFELPPTCSPTNAPTKVPTTATTTTVTTTTVTTTTGTSTSSSATITTSTMSMTTTTVTITTSTATSTTKSSSTATTVSTTTMSTSTTRTSSTTSTTSTLSSTTVSTVSTTTFTSLTVTTSTVTSVSTTITSSSSTSSTTSSTTVTTATTTQIVLCTDIPTPYMLSTGKTCDTWTWMYINRCNSPPSVNSFHDDWTTNKHCQLSCYLNDNGYDGDICVNGGGGSFETTLTTVTTDMVGPETPDPEEGTENTPGTAVTTSTPAVTTSTPASSICTNIPSSTMISKGLTCETWTWMYTHRCNAADDVNNYRTTWTTNKYCQLSCFQAGNGYDGDDCSGIGLVNVAEGISPNPSPNDSGSNAMALAVLVVGALIIVLVAAAVGTVQQRNQRSARRALNDLWIDDDSRYSRDFPNTFHKAGSSARRLEWDSTLY